MDKSIGKYLRNNVFKQKDNEQMALLESQKKSTFTNYCISGVFLFREKRNLITSF